MPHNPVPDVLAVHRNYHQIVSVNTTLGVGFFFSSRDNCLISIPGSRRSDYQRIDDSVTRDLLFLFLYIAVRRGTLAAAAPLLAGVRRLHGRS